MVCHSMRDAYTHLVIEAVNAKYPTQCSDSSNDKTELVQRLRNLEWMVAYPTFEQPTWMDLSISKAL